MKANLSVALAAASCALLCSGAGSSPALAEDAEPLTVLRSFFNAEDANNVDAALTYWADDGTFVNSRGRKSAGREQLRMFIQSAVNAKVHHEMKSPRVVGDRAFWTEDETTDFYRKLGIQSVKNVSEALIQGGKIKSLMVYFPLEEIARIRQACDTPQAEGLSMFGLTCTEFARLTQAHTESVTKK